MSVEYCSVCSDVLPSGSEIEEKNICMDCLLEEQKTVIGKLSISDLIHVPGAFALTEGQRTLLISVYKSHLLGMGTIKRQSYMPGHLKKVAWDQEDKTVNVYFDNDWWHYTDDHRWY